MEIINFAYTEINLKLLDRALKENGEFHLLLSARRGRILKIMMESHGGVYLMDTVPFGLIKSLWLSIKALILMLWVFVAHQKLIEVFGIISVEKVNIAWDRAENEKWHITVKSI